MSFQPNVKRQKIEQDIKCLIQSISLNEQWVTLMLDSSQPSNIKQNDLKFKLKIKTGMNKILLNSSFIIIKVDKHNLHEKTCKVGNNYNFTCIDQETKVPFILKLCRYGEFQYVLQDFEGVKDFINGEKRFIRAEEKDSNFKYLAFDKIIETDKLKILFESHAPTDYQQIWSNFNGELIPFSFSWVDRPNQTWCRSKTGKPLGIMIVDRSEVYPASATIWTKPSLRRRVKKLAENLNYSDNSYGILLQYNSDCGDDELPDENENEIEKQERLERNKKKTTISRFIHRKIRSTRTNQ